MGNPNSARQYQEPLSDYSPRATASQEFRDRGQQMSEEDEQVLHDVYRAERPEGKAAESRVLMQKLDVDTHRPDG